ncbi:hypothetical protein GLOIN_2v1847779 [Rhizophagus clarus]|uniref:Uncharacterized protein n=1 Tax=Rhizophagus clarus TaxID=94130 RepID=A0A8H3L6Y3_9GLOM|nr:hypothetical protein GLOIN_2v1847779 [Rhizophagus clarus]
MPQSPLSDHEVLNNLIQLQVPITCDYFQKTLNEELILVNDENTQYSFFYNYPSNPYIHAVRVFSVKYTVEWTDENGQIKSRYSLSSAGAAGFLFLKEICNKLNSRVSGTILFSLDIGFLQQIREIIASQP